MIRIMLMCSLVFGFLLAIILGFSIELMTEDFKGSKTDSLLIANKINEIEDDRKNQDGTSLLPLMTENWGKDFFYNRSNAYESLFKLTGITRFENGFKAMINENILIEGDRIKGFTLKRIDANQVILKRGKYRVTLKLEK
ncbi:MAG: hypothetical protein CMG04_10580 [Candidatus Marinimicrobia bacterium]|nr:hypothetical protein [Candidatus Neomarinimicrobiota bacterium]|tara:strand:- start:985 stop:1404 length:420 start_codon:yes stop_codon:yes gene_type:complete